MKINFPLLALAIGAFAIGTTEFSPMGLLPNIAHDLNIGIPTAGMLITGYALGVMLGAPVMTLWLGHISRRKALILLMMLFTIGNLMAAIAPNYWSLMAARLITSLNHGAFFGIGSVVAASVVPAHKQASAVASMFMGLTIANIGGVPLATWLGQTIGWRTAFFAISALGVITMWSLFKALPQGSTGQRPDIKAEIKVLTGLPVIIALLTTVLGASAMFTLYTYIAPSLQHAGYPDFCNTDVGFGGAWLFHWQSFRWAICGSLYQSHIDCAFHRPHCEHAQLPLFGTKPTRSSHCLNHLGCCSIRTGASCANARDEHCP